VSVDATVFKMKKGDLRVIKNSHLRQRDRAREPESACMKKRERERNRERVE